METSGGNLCRIRECAVDLLSTEDDLVALDGGEVDDSSWELVGHNLRLRSIFMYCDLTGVVSGTPDGEAKRSLTHLANQFFVHMEELQNAVELRNVSETRTRCNELIDALRELMAVLLPDTEFSSSLRPVIAAEEHDDMLP